MKNFVINKIVTLYNQYKEVTSEVMFNAQTDYLIDSIMEIPLCSDMINSLKNKQEYVVCTKEIEKRLHSYTYKWLPDVIYKGQNCYLSFCIQAYWYLREEKSSVSCKNYLEPYYSDMGWLRAHVVNKGNDMEVFKTSFILPLINYLCNAIDEESVILYYLKRYRQRVERFTHNIFSKDDKEPVFQRDLALFLFDQEITFYKESETGNGRTDFQILYTDSSGFHYGTNLECNDSPYVVEIKVCDDETKIDTKAWEGQLNAYLRQLGGTKGCILVYIRDVKKKDGNIFKETEQIKYIPIYLGVKTPCKQKRISTTQ